MKKTKKHLWIMVIVLLLCTIILIVVERFILRDSFWRSYLVSLSATLLGITISIWFIEIIINNARKQEQKESSRKKAERIILILKPFLANYRSAAILISNKISETGAHSAIQKGFPFTILSEMYAPQILATEPLRKSKVELYFEKVDKLKSIITNILLNVDLTDFPEFSELMANYVEEMERSYPKDVLLKFKYLYSENKDGKRTPMTTLIANKIRDYKGEDTKDNHFLMPVMRLYEIIHYHIDFIENYERILNHITK